MVYPRRDDSSRPRRRRSRRNSFRENECVVSDYQSASGSGGLNNDTSRVDGRVIVAIFVVGTFGLLAYFALAMPGMDHQVGTMLPGTTTRTETTPAWSLTPAAFERFVQDNDPMVINVHVPYEGEILQSDAFVAFENVIGSTALPSDPTAPIALYCRSGRMSRIAGESLRAAGYSNAVDLNGGMDAWQASGRTMVINDDRDVLPPGRERTPLP